MNLFPQMGIFQFGASLQYKGVGELVRLGCNGGWLLKVHCEEHRERLRRVRAAAVGSNHGVPVVRVGVLERVEDEAGMVDVSCRRESGESKELAVGLMVGFCA